MRLINLQIDKWQNFHDLGIDFDDRVTFITGINGTGKTSICKLLASYVVGTREFNDMLDLSPSGTHLGRITSRMIDDEVRIDAIFKDGPEEQAKLYNIEFNDLPSAHYGIYIRSNRSPLNYIDIEDALPVSDAEDSLFESFTVDDDFHMKYGSSKYYKSSFEGMKQTLINWAVYGYGNAAVEPNDYYRTLFERFVEILKSAFPPEIQLQKITVASAQVYCVTDRGRFPLDAASSGLATILEIYWKIYMSSLGSHNNENIIIIDEPENHLHPSMQQNIVSNLTSVFPNSQFIIATHSPLVLSSVKNASIYALFFEGEYVTSRKLSDLDLSGDAEYILREALGLSSTMPRWAYSELRNIIQKYSLVKPDAAMFNELDRELKLTGLEEYSNRALKSILDSRNEKN